MRALLTMLRTGRRVAGAKQVRRALRDRSAKLVFLARDADPAFVSSIREECLAQGVELCEDFSMKELGAAAGIQVGAAVCALLR